MTSHIPDTRGDFSGHTDLEYLNLSLKPIRKLDVSKNKALKFLSCYNVNRNEDQDFILNVSESDSLKFLSCDFNHISSLDISNNLALEHLSVAGNNITTLDVTQNLDLMHLACGYNQIDSLDLSNNHKLIYLDCGENSISCLVLEFNCVNLKVDTWNFFPIEICVWTLPFHKPVKQENSS